MKQTFFTFFLIACTGMMYAGIEITDLRDTTIRVPVEVDATNYFYLDVNNDSITDFVIGASHFQSYEGHHPPYDAYMIFIKGKNDNLVHELPLFDNDTIDVGLNFTRYTDVYGIYPGIGLVGMWPFRLEPPYSPAFIGLQVNSGQQTNYAWLELKTDGVSFTISRYAFNTTAGQPITAGTIE